MRLVKTKVRINQITDNPGRPGKDRARLVGSIPQKFAMKIVSGEAGFTGSSVGVRTLTEMRNRNPRDEKR